MNTVEMAHGSGGQAMQQLINRLFMEAFNNLARRAGRPGAH